MATDLDSIKKVLVGISKGEGLLDTLLEFERTLDNAELFAYKNWILGELVEGPVVGRYWYSVKFMFPYDMMPDPDGGLRLTKLGARVNFQKGVFKKPVKVHGPEDWVDPQSKRAKMAEHEVWIVSIELPIKYIQRGLEQTDEIIQKDIDDTNAELADAYEEPPMDDGMAGEDLGMDDMGMEDDMSGADEGAPGGL